MNIRFHFYLLGLLFAFPVLGQQASPPGSGATTGVFKFEISADPGEFLTGLSGAKVNVLHTQQTASLQVTGDERQVEFTVSPFGATQNLNDVNGLIWKIKVEQRLANRFRQGRYRHVANNPAYGRDLTVSILPQGRFCPQQGKADLRIVDVVGSSVNRFGLTYELACGTLFNTRKVKGSFYLNYSGDDLFTLSRSALRANSNNNYSPYFYPPERVLDNNLNSIWIGQRNPSRAFRLWSLRLNQTKSRRYRLHSADVLLYYSHKWYAPDFIGLRAFDGENLVTDVVPHSQYGVHSIYSNIPKIKFSLEDRKHTDIDFILYGTSMYPIVRDIVVWAYPHSSEWQNRANPCDVDGDGDVRQAELLSVIRFGNTNGTNYNFPAERPLAENYYDLNGDEKFNQLDLLKAANCMRQIQ